MRASQEFEDTVPMIDEMIMETRLEVRGKSLKSAAAGLRAWQSYSVLLGYDPLATLPPRSSRDMQRFIMIFSNANTAANYVSYVVYGCKLCELDLSCWTRA